MSGSFMDSAAVLTFVAIPCEVTWSYCVGGAVFLIGLVKMFLRGDWQKARGFDKLILFGPPVLVQLGCVTSDVQRCRIVRGELHVQLGCGHVQMLANGLTNH